ncbi:hypothetical protein INS49_002088 [Diaporthe citri]|uniref:uncharacterized protein n=1 Tax=Diaporthe citri TaxID=83186 RepID=UPI001C822D31|nr:uncharacterized protein INS49_002088 [Diaporthe citri]KAG6367889.1 hypothetical protein INS49_002088 [Diaporthe citri]
MDRKWVEKYQARNTISSDAARKEGSSEVLPNSDGRAGSLPAAIDILEGKHIGHK